MSRFPSIVVSVVASCAALSSCENDASVCDRAVDIITDATLGACADNDDCCYCDCFLDGEADNDNCSCGADDDELGECEGDFEAWSQDCLDDEDACVQGVVEAVEANCELLVTDTD